ncbi:MAG TPA: hypothetical protein VFY28_02755 [Candidatus Paceibacterota bacterium]|nr:hypothetical protein [Candidatus Paceibacterota bacterium]
MDLDKRQWYVTWFFVSLAVLDKFRGRTWWDSDLDRYKNGTNLCHFIRVILLWTPLVYALHILVYGTAIAILTYWPIRLFGFNGYIATIIGIVTFVVVVVGAAFALQGLVSLLAYIRSNQHERAVERAKQESDKDVPAPQPAKVRHGPSFGEVLWSYLVAAKQKVCPIINFKQLETQS